MRVREVSLQHGAPRPVVHLPLDGSPVTVPGWPYLILEANPDGPGVVALCGRDDDDRFHQWTETEHIVETMGRALGDTAHLLGEAHRG